MSLRSFRLPIARRLAGDRRGATLIEFGLVAPVLALMIAGIVDLSRGLAQRHQLQQALDRSLELLMANPPAGDPDDATVDYSYVSTDVAAAAGVDASRVSLDRWLQCDGTRQDSFSATCPAGQDSARYLQVAVNKPFDGAFYTGLVTIAAYGTIRIQ